MDDAAHKRHGNFPQRKPSASPWVSNAEVHATQEAETPETRPCSESTKDLLDLPDEHKKRRRRRRRRRKRRSSRRRPDTSVEPLMKRIRVHPEAQRILGVSKIAVVSLERLNLQPLHRVESLTQLPCQRLNPSRAEASGPEPQQSGLEDNEPDVHEVVEEEPPAEEAESTTCDWKDPVCSDGSWPGPPEQESGVDCESNPDQLYILFDSESEERNPNDRTSPETFYVDPDLDGELVIEDDPELVEFEKDTDQNQACSETPGLGPDESEDFCAVCLNGGDLLCCDNCPKVFHLSCHVPSLAVLPRGDWLCSLCRSDLEQKRENLHDGGPGCTNNLSPRDQTRCEKLTLLLYCHLLSAPFHEPVSAQARNYYQIIKRPMDLSVICEKLDQSNSAHYSTAEQFVDDVMLMIRNCATFNYPDSEVAQAGQNLEVFFLGELKEVFPDRIFLSATRDRMDKARHRWLSRKKSRTFLKN